jgi:hypothetical protein
VVNARPLVLAHRPRRCRPHVATIAIFDHPGNIGYPTYWHARGYGLFAVNPLGRHAFDAKQPLLNYTLEKGQAATFRYRIVFYTHAATADELNREADAFAAAREAISSPPSMVTDGFSDLPIVSSTGLQMISLTMRSVKNRSVPAARTRIDVSEVMAITCSPNSTKPASDAISTACTQRLMLPPKIRSALPIRPKSCPSTPCPT